MDSDGGDDNDDRMNTDNEDDDDNRSVVSSTKAASTVASSVIPANTIDFFMKNFYEKGVGANDDDDNSRSARRQYSIAIPWLYEPASCVARSLEALTMAEMFGLARFICEHRKGTFYLPECLLASLTVLLAGEFKTREAISTVSSTTNTLPTVLYLSKHLAFASRLKRLLCNSFSLFNLVATDGHHTEANTVVFH